MADITEEQTAYEIQASPGLYLVLKPEKNAFDILDRISRLSPVEKTAKDFIDLFGYTGILLTLGPAEEEYFPEDNQWRGLIPGKFSRLKASRETYTGRRAGQKFLVIYLADKAMAAALPQWKELVSRIVRRFF